MEPEIPAGTTRAGDAPMARGRILIVDDEASARSALAEILTDEGYKVKTAADGFRALGAATEFEPDIVLTDLKMPGMSGIELLRRLREQGNPAQVVVMTAFGEVESAVAAIRAGATDYLTKPLNSDALLIVLGRSLDSAELRRETVRLREKLNERYSFSEIVGQSQEMQAVFKIVRQIAPSRATVLLGGESGTGKEKIAASIHHNSPRASGPFVRLHCAALAESLLESELFGHERGAFTGADRRREGRFEQADGGTLFLDEVGEISPAVQVKLLRVLQEHEFERVGGNQTIRVDVRLIAATNRDLKKMVAAGKFREDLYYRLNVIHLDLPPLRARSSDIPALALHFLARAARENGKTLETIDDDALLALRSYAWPGNVRELENVIERATVLEEGPRLSLRSLPPEISSPDQSNRMGPQIPGSTLEQIERYAIMETLAAVGGSTTKAAEALGISVRTIQYRLQQYGAAPKSGSPVLRD
ncbi:MAG TPA: sigma-54 dependent transcriptional regulator [Polyangiaceae bacterium]|nr:sigma-54 dependent transcriptional regulator [Polyangiaceae bacterium]